ncbi:MAG: XdhC family protein [Pirellulales bacterium]
MLALCRRVVEECSAGRAVAFCTLVESRGSTPQETGAKMLVLADGTLVGTLGGGCVEAEVRLRALELLHNRRSELQTFRLDRDYGWDDGLICGGTMAIFIRTLSSPTDAAPYAEIAAAIERRRPIEFVFDYATEAGPKNYRESIEPTPKLVIAGGGHVGQALSEMAAWMEFDVAVIDDRAEYVSEKRFPHAKERIVGDIAASLAEYPIDATTYVVIVTRGHKHDGGALDAVVRSDAHYVGLIGSKRKIAVIMADLFARDATREQLARVHAPIGLEIDAVTVPEIAVSIAAELVAVRRGRDGIPAAPMKLTFEQLDKLLKQNRLDPQAKDV